MTCRIESCNFKDPGTFVFESDCPSSSKTAVSIINFISESLRKEKCSLAEDVRANIAEGTDDLFLSLDIKRDGFGITYSVIFDCEGSLIAETIRSHNDPYRHEDIFDGLFGPRTETILKELNRYTILNVLFNNRDLLSDEVRCLKESLDAMACVLDL